MDHRYHVFILEDPDDIQNETNEFINIFLQKFNCHPHNPYRRCDVYLPRNDDTAGKTKFENVHNAVSNSKMILCIISPWNTYWINHCRQASFYEQIVNNKRSMFIPVFLGYSSAAEAKRACPEEIRCQTPVIFKASWRDDHASWQKLERSLQIPGESVPPESDGPATRVAVQCTDPSDPNHLNGLSQDGPPSSPVSSPNTATDRNFMTEIMEASPYRERERDMVLDVPGPSTDGPSPLSVSRSGGLFQDSSDSSRHAASDSGVVSSDESSDEASDDRSLPSEVTVDMGRSGESQHHGLTDHTSPKLLHGSDGYTGGGLFGRLPSNVTDDIEDESIDDFNSSLNDQVPRSIDSAYSTSDGGQSGNEATAERQTLHKGTNVQQIRVDVEQTDAVVQQPDLVVQQTEAVVQQTEPDVEQTEADVEQTEAVVQQTEPDVEQTEADVEHTEENVQQTEENVQQTEENVQQVEKNVQQIGADEQQTCAHVLRNGTDVTQNFEGAQNAPGNNALVSHDWKSDHQQGTFGNGQASEVEESATSDLNPAMNAAGQQGIAKGMWPWRALVNIWELIQYY